MIPALVLLAMAQPNPRPDEPAAVDPSASGPAIGQAIPAFRALDQEGRSRDFASLAGPNGLVLVFFRSADW